MTNKKRNMVGQTLHAAGWTLLLSQSAWGSGFALIEQSVSEMGTAYAGASAQATDASTIFFNPAGMTRLPGAQTVAGMQVIIPEAKFNDKGSSSTPGAILGRPGLLGTREGNDAGESGIAPAVYYTQQFGDKWFAGVGVNVPFGLKTKYDQNWVGRYYGVKSELKTVNINPSVAYKVSDRLSLGAGISYQYIDAELTNQIDFGTIGILSALGLGMPELAAGLTPGGNDGRVKISGNDWSWGANVGILYSITEQTRLGLHYRSKIEHSLEGYARYRIPDEARFLQATGSFISSNVKADVDLPASFSTSVYHDITPKWAILADVTWTDWSNLHEIRFDFDSSQPDGVETLKWEDSFRYSLGVKYQPNERWVYRCGVAYDETPIPNRQYRSVRVPGNDRTWVALGLGYRHNDSLSFDVGYAHLFVDDPEIDKGVAEVEAEAVIMSIAEAEGDPGPVVARNAH